MLSPKWNGPNNTSRTLADRRSCGTPLEPLGWTLSPIADYGTDFEAERGDFAKTA